jgi:hypothetical protein
MDPKERLRKACRVLAVQTGLERLAAWRVSDLEHRHASLRNQQASLVRFLDGETALGDVLSATILRRLQCLAENQAALIAEREVCDARRREERLRLRCAELIVDDLARETRRMDVLRELESVIETSQQRPCVRSEQG